MMRLALAVTIALLAVSLGGCLHTVHYVPDDSGAHWYATPYTDTTGVPR